MENNYLVKETKIIAKKQETADIFLFTLQLKNGSVLNFNPGQFILAGIPGFGESAFDICSSSIASPTFPPPPFAEGEVGGGGNKKTFQICVRNVGVNTAKMVDLRIGDSIFIRGPFGNGFPLEKFRNKNILMVGGGTGIIVIRGLLQHFLTMKQWSNETMKLQIFYGARDWNSLLFKDEFTSWKKIASVHLILENPSSKYPCQKGLITELFEIVPIIEKPTIIMCGPPIMYKFCLQKINEKLQVPENEIYLSLERRMHCGVGVCQHCAIGPKYVCKDGPVFTYEELKMIKNAI